MLCSCSITPECGILILLKTTHVDLYKGSVLDLFAVASTCNLVAMGLNMFRRNAPYLSNNIDSNISSVDVHVCGVPCLFDRTLKCIVGKGVFFSPTHTTTIKFHNVNSENERVRPFISDIITITDYQY